MTVNVSRESELIKEFCEPFINRNGFFFNFALAGEIKEITDNTVTTFNIPLCQLQRSGKVRKIIPLQGILDEIKGICNSTKGVRISWLTVAVSCPRTASLSFWTNSCWAFS